MSEQIMVDGPKHDWHREKQVSDSNSNLHKGRIWLEQSEQVENSKSQRAHGSSIIFSYVRTLAFEMGSHENLSREVIKEEIKEVIQEQPKGCCVGNRLQGARVEPGK